MPRVFRTALMMAIVAISLFGISGVSAARSNPEVSEEQYTAVYNRSLCYNGVTVRAPSIYQALRAGLVIDSPAEGGYVLASDNVFWGPCSQDGRTFGTLRLTNPNPAVYVTACDDLSSLGGMRLSYAFYDGAQEANVVYLLHELEDDVCGLNTGVTTFYTASGEDWSEACLSHAILVVYGAPEDFMPLVQFRCGSGGVEL
jgi:hypothetical protein